MKLLVINSTHEEVAMEEYPHLAPWKMWADMPKIPNNSSLWLLSWYDKTVHPFPVDLHEMGKEEEYMKKYDADLIFSWARYW